MRDFCWIIENISFSHLTPATNFNSSQTTYFISYFLFYEASILGFLLLWRSICTKCVDKQVLWKYYRVSQKKCSQVVGIGWNLETFFLEHPVCIYWATELRWCCYHYLEINKHWGKEIFDTASQILFTVLMFCASLIPRFYLCCNVIEWREKPAREC